MTDVFSKRPDRQLPPSSTRLRHVHYLCRAPSLSIDVLETGQRSKIGAALDPQRERGPDLTRPLKPEVGAVFVYTDSFIALFRPTARGSVGQIP